MDKNCSLSYALTGLRWGYIQLCLIGIQFEEFNSFKLCLVFVTWFCFNSLNISCIAWLSKFLVVWNMDYCPVKLKPAFNSGPWHKTIPYYLFNCKVICVSSIYESWWKKLWFAAPKTPKCLGSWRHIETT